MVLLDKRSEILEQLATIIEDGIGELNEVFRRPLSSGQLSADNFPAIDISFGPSTVDRELTSTIDQVVSAVLRIYTEDDEDGFKGFDIYDKLVSLIETNPTLNDTCISALGQGGDQPRIFAGNITSTHMDYQLVITYRRDIV